MKSDGRGRYSVWGWGRSKQVRVSTRAMGEGDHEIIFGGKIELCRDGGCRHKILKQQLAFGAIYFNACHGDDLSQFRKPPMTLSIILLKI